MPRLVETGAAKAVAIGYQEGPHWYPLTSIANGALTIDVNPVVVTTENGTMAAAGDNTILAALPATERYVVTAFCIQNASAVATTGIIRSGATTNGWRCLGQTQGDGLAMTFTIGREWRLNAGEALVLNLSAAQTWNYSVSYYREAS